jgi:regulator of protease activity HflC (stomatin/prohibitin superfamily)
MIESITIIVIAMVVIMLMQIVVIYTRLRKFTPNDYVIWIRSGKVKKTSIGGSGLLLPMIDEVIALPLMIQETAMEINIYDYQNFRDTLIVTTKINWRIEEPEIYYAKIYSNKQEKEKNELIRNLFASAIREILATKNYETIMRRKRELIKEMKEEMNEKMDEYGIIIEALELEEIKKEYRNEKFV